MPSKRKKPRRRTDKRLVIAAIAAALVLLLCYIVLSNILGNKPQEENFILTYQLNSATGNYTLKMNASALAVKHSLDMTHWRIYAGTDTSASPIWDSYQYPVAYYEAIPGTYTILLRTHSSWDETVDYRQLITVGI
jgi:hypothetical protein